MLSDVLSDVLPDLLPDLLLRVSIVNSILIGTFLPAYRILVLMHQRAASNEGSGESAHIHSLAGSFPFRIYKVRE